MTEKGRFYIPDDQKHAQGTDVQTKLDASITLEPVPTPEKKDLDAFTTYVVNEALNVLDQNMSDNTQGWYGRMHDRNYAFEDQTYPYRYNSKWGIAMNRILARIPQVLQAEGATVNDDRHLPYLGQMDHNNNQVTLRPDRFIHQRLETSLHEYAHLILHHPSQTNNLSVKEREGQAEGVSFVVAAYCGHASDETINDIKRYGPHPAVLKQSFPLIKQTALYIIDKLDLKNLKKHIHPGAEFDPLAHEKANFPERFAKVVIKQNPRISLQPNEGIYAEWEERIFNALAESDKDMSAYALAQATGLSYSQVQRTLQFRDEEKILMVRQGRKIFYRT